jgi:GTP1/Obg family GTP-binding protein
MIFPMSDPWIDPRYKLVTAAQAEDYLQRHGWQKRAYPMPEVHVFEGPVADSGRPIRQYVPQIESTDDFHRCMLDVITSVARLEKRRAVDVLDDMLGVASPSGNGSANGHPVLGKEPAAKT